MLQTWDAGILGCMTCVDGAAAARIIADAPVGKVPSPYDSIAMMFKLFERQLAPGVQAAWRDMVSGESHPLIGLRNMTDAPSLKAVPSVSAKLVTWKCAQQPASPGYHCQCRARLSARSQCSPHTVCIIQQHTHSGWKISHTHCAPGVDVLPPR